MCICNPLLEHLELVQSVNLINKSYTLRQDEEITLIDQIIPVNAEGAWNMKGHSYIFELDNWYVIDGIFKALYMIGVTVYNPIKEVTI